MTDTLAALHAERLHMPEAPWRGGEPTTDLGPELELRAADIDGARNVSIWRAGARCSAWIPCRTVVNASPRKRVTGNKRRASQ